MGSVVKKFDSEDEKKIKSLFQSVGAVFDNVQYAYFRAKCKDFNAVFYKSGKLLLQGAGAESFCQRHFGDNMEAKTNNSIEHSFTSWIGIDESGKGDFFGPLVVAGVLVEEKNKEMFLKAGIKDSKKLNDPLILKLACEIKNNAVFDCLIISPIKYNELYQSFKNLNKLLAWGHATVLENILKKQHCENAISDKFGNEKLIKDALKEKGKNVNLIQVPKAEADIAVACASVVARAAFVLKMKEMSQKWGMNFTKGASNLVVQDAKRFVQKYSKQRLSEVSKIHFKTYEEL